MEELNCTKGRVGWFLVAPASCRRAAESARPYINGDYILYVIFGVLRVAALRRACLQDAGANRAKRGLRRDRVADLKFGHYIRQHGAEEWGLGISG